MCLTITVTITKNHSVAPVPALLSVLTSLWKISCFLSQISLPLSPHVFKGAMNLKEKKGCIWSSLSERVWIKESEARNDGNIMSLKKYIKTIQENLYGNQ